MTVAGGAAYGAAAGAWRGGLMVVFAAVKLPLALLATAWLAMLINCAVAHLFGLRISCAQSLRVTLLATASSSALLLALAPLAWWLSITTPPPASGQQAHALLCLVHLALVAAASLPGAAVLWQALGRYDRCPKRRRKVFVAWLMVIAALGAQVTWTLRPFIGSTDHPVRFLRQDALAGNAVGYLLFDLLPEGRAAGKPPAREPDGPATAEP